MADHQAAYEAYTKEPTSANLNSVIGALRPTIDYTLASIQASDDPILRTKAHVLAAKAIQSYSPESGAALHTWVSNQLLPLRRIRRQTQAVVKTPERVQLDAYSLSRAENEFIDKFNREPDVQELADHSKIPVKRIKQIRGMLRKTPSESALGGSGFESETDFDDEATRYVHLDADHIDRRIIELKTGYGGSPMLQPAEIATKLGLTPTQLTRRSQRLAYKIQEVASDLKRVQ